MQQYENFLYRKPDPLIKSETQCVSIQPDPGFFITTLPIIQIFQQYF